MIIILCASREDVVTVFLNVFSIDLSETEILACKHFSSYFGNSMSKYWMKNN